MGLCNSKQSVSPDIFAVDISNVARHNYEGVYRYARFSNIYDGDTADIYFINHLGDVSQNLASEKNENIIRAPFRFYGYDSAEMKPLKSLADRDNHIKAAKADKEYLTTLLSDKYYVVKFAANEKYGRMMGIVWQVTDVSISENNLSTHHELTDQNQINLMMINSGHGKPYFGGKKEN